MKGQLWARCKKYHKGSVKAREQLVSPQPTPQKTRREKEKIRESSRGVSFGRSRPLEDPTRIINIIGMEPWKYPNHSLLTSSHFFLRELLTLPKLSGASLGESLEQISWVHLPQQSEQNGREWMCWDKLMSGVSAISI